MLTRETAITMAKDYVSLCNEKDIKFSHVYVFGSSVNGNAGVDSDVDLLLVSEQFTENTLTNWKMLAPFSAKMYEIDPHPYPVAAFIKRDPFVNEVLKTGIRI